VGNDVEVREFETLKAQARQEIEAGNLDRAAQLLEEALAWAEDHGTADQSDYARVGVAAITIQRGNGESAIPMLREILMRSGSIENCRLAAYHISLQYEHGKNFKKSLFYARIARDRAEQLGVADWQASSHNQVGNALLGESFVEDAAVEYEKALEFVTPKSVVSRALILQNLGYCRVLQREFRQGYALLYESLRMFRGRGVERYQTLLNLDLCFAHLETGRFQHAERRGLTALRLAERNEQGEAMKNALYLLGEAASLAGKADEARSYFSHLQGTFYPNATYLPSFLAAVDVRKLINLHA
jgi:tetratricopeptide (TPR) repeat protein